VRNIVLPSQVTNTEMAIDVIARRWRARLRWLGCSDSLGSGEAGAASVTGW